MIHPFLLFSGNDSEAIVFYESVFQTEPAQVLKYGTYVPEGIESVPSDLSEKVLHAEMTISGVRCWLADEFADTTPGANLRLSVTLADKQACQTVYDRLFEGGQVTLEPVSTFYSDFHGAGIDRYGFHWNVVSETHP